MPSNESHDTGTESNPSRIEGSKEHSARDVIYTKAVGETAHRLSLVEGKHLVYETASLEDAFKAPEGCTVQWEPASLDEAPPAVNQFIVEALRRLGDPRRESRSGTLVMEVDVTAGPGFAAISEKVRAFEAWLADIEERFSKIRGMAPDQLKVVRVVNVDPGAPPSRTSTLPVYHLHDRLLGRRSGLYAEIIGADQPEAALVGSRSQLVYRVVDESGETHRLSAEDVDANFVFWRRCPSTAIAKPKDVDAGQLWRFRRGPVRSVLATEKVDTGMTGYMVAAMDGGQRISVGTLLSSPGWMYFGDDPAVEKATTAASPPSEEVGATGRKASARAPVSYVTEEGVVQIPEEVRRKLSLEKGGGVVFVQEKDHGHFRMLSDAQFMDMIAPNEDAPTTSTPSQEIRSTDGKAHTVRIRETYSSRMTRIAGLGADDLRAECLNLEAALTTEEKISDNLKREVELLRSAGAGRRLHPTTPGTERVILEQIEKELAPYGREGEGILGTITRIIRGATSTA